MPYTYYTFTDFNTALAARLADPSKVFWPDAELTSFQQEALRTWNAMSQWAHDRFTFNTVNGTAFYDITDLTVAPNTLINSVTARDNDIIPDVQIALMEPTSTVSWTGTEMFTMKDVANALWNRRNQFMMETGCLLFYNELATGAPTVSRVPITGSPLFDLTIDVRRVQWKTAGNVYSNLWRADEHQFNSFTPGWSATAVAVPTSYSTILVPPLTVQVAPVGNTAGTLALITINALGIQDIGNSGTSTLMPTDYIWALKFGILADLLSKDGEARDPTRAAYCEQRFQEGVQLCKIAASVTNLELVGSQIPIDALTDWDTFNPGWQNTTGTPVRAALAGRNLLALYPVPNGVFTITVDCVRNALTTQDTSNLQIPREYLDVLLGYAEHLARFKQAGAEWEATIPLYQNMMRLAADYNSRLRANAEQFVALHEKEQRPFRRNNMRLEDATAA